MKTVAILYASLFASAAFAKDPAGVKIECRNLEFREMTSLYVATHDDPKQDGNSSPGGVGMGSVWEIHVNGKNREDGYVGPEENDGHRFTGWGVSVGKRNFRITKKGADSAQIIEMDKNWKEQVGDATGDCTVEKNPY